MNLRRKRAPVGNAGLPAGNGQTQATGSWGMTFGATPALDSAGGIVGAGPVGIAEQGRAISRSQTRRRMSVRGEDKMLSRSNGCAGATSPPAGQASEIRTALVGGIRTARISRQELAAVMVRDVACARADTQAAPRVVVASNGATIARYHTDQDFRALIDAADIVDPDGQPLVLATRLLLHEPLHERVATTDFINDAAAAAAANGTRFFFLGARPGVAAIAAERLREAFPGLEVVGVEHGYFSQDEIPDILARIRASRADVLWLGLGSPVQERFAIEYRAQLQGLAWIRTCGGLFDHIGTDIARAPLWMRRAGFEWLFRTILEPRRLGWRYLVTNPVAVYYLLTKTRS